MKGLSLRKVLFGVVLSLLIITAYFLGLLSAKYDGSYYDVLKAISKDQVTSLSKKISNGTGEFGEKGRWRTVRTVNEKGLTEEQQESLSKISALPYLKGYRTAPDAENVTVYDKTAYNGLNFVLSGHAPQAFLMDMKGNILHQWSYDFNDVWPGELDFIESDIHKTFWRRAHLFPNGDLLAIFEGIGLIKLDKNSKLLWSYKGRTHHDLFITENGNIYVLTRHKLLKPKQLPVETPILEDFITILSSDGQEIRKISILDVFLNSNYASVLLNVRNGGDVFHTNTLEIIDGEIVDRYPLLKQMFKQGSVLISLRKLHTIAVVDIERETVTWALTGMWNFQHQPTLLKNGNLLVFDNNSNNGESRVIEINPLTQKIVWSYKGSEKDKFFSDTCGSNFRLPNGNTLITESDNGRAFEVTPDNKIVWEFINPYRAGTDNELIATLFEVIRMDVDYFSGQDWLSLSSDIN